MLQHKHSKHRIGALLVVVSALVFSSAGIFTKGVETQAWDIIFWRGVSAAGFSIMYLMWNGRVVQEVRAFSAPALGVTITMAMGTAAFIPAFKFSTVANVALIYAAAPFVAAALAWRVMREVLSWRVIWASIFAFLGVLIIVSGSFGASQIKGDMLALLMTVMMASAMVIYRKYPQTTAALPAALSSVILLPVSLAISDPLGIPASEIPVLIAFGLVFAVASITLSEGARRLPAGETALLSTLEMPLAPILALAFLAEVPSGTVILGGAVIFAAVVWSQKPPPGSACVT